MPPWLSHYSSTWKLRTPDFEYRYQSNNEFCSYLESEHSYDMAKSFYNLVGATKGDFWRFYVLAKYGGVYVDIDTICYRSLDTLFDSAAESSIICSYIDSPDGIYHQNWFIGSTNDNLAIKQSRDEMFNLIENNKLFNSREIPDIWDKNIKSNYSNLMVYKFYGDSIGSGQTEIAKHFFASNVWSDFGNIKNYTEKSFWAHPSDLSFKRVSNVNNAKWEQP